MKTSMTENQHVTLSDEARRDIIRSFDALGSTVQHPDARVHVDIKKGGHGGFVVSATLVAAGEEYNAEATRSTVIEGVDETLHVLKERISKHRSRSRVLAKRAGDMFKKMARFGRG